MTARDRLWVSLRHMKTGVVGVLLVVLATAIGIALAASTSAFIRAYRVQTKRLLDHPVYREVLVEVLGADDIAMATPVVEIERETSRSSFMTMADMEKAAEAAPAVEYAYLSEFFEMVTTASLVRLGKNIGDEKKETGVGRGEKASGEAAGEAAGDSAGADIVKLPVDEFPGLRTTNEFFSAYGLTAADGFLFTKDDLDAGNLVIVLGSELAKILFPDGGAVGSRISLYYQTITIVGVLEPTHLAHPGNLVRYNNMAFVPQAALEKVWNKRVPITEIHFAAKSSSDLRAAVNQLATYFASAHPDANLMITDSVEELRKERQTLSRVIAVLVFISAVGLFIAAINLLNLMLIRIIKHTRGIGVMRALGTTRREVFRQFMNESALMCSAGAVIGVIVSPQVFRLLQNVIVSGEGFASQTFTLDLLAGGAVGLIFSVAFGVYPAILAKNIDASLAIRAE